MGALLEAQLPETVAEPVECPGVRAAEDEHAHAIERRSGRRASAFRTRGMAGGSLSQARVARTGTEGVDWREVGLQDQLYRARHVLRLPVSARRTCLLPVLLAHRASSIKVSGRRNVPGGVPLDVMRR